MSIEKTSAVVVTLIPWRESSFIVTLFTKEHGMISGAAKGVRRAKQMNVPLERGQIIDTVIYIRNARSVQTLTDIQISGYYPSIRGDLEKTALRDIALELLLKAVKDTHSHPELFDRVVQCFNGFECALSRTQLFPALWNFIVDIAGLLGFGFSVDKCIVCKKGDCLTDKEAYLVIEQGGLVCDSCAHMLKPEYLIPSTVCAALRGTLSDTAVFTSHECLRLTKLFIAYCKYHMEFSQELRSVSFLEEIL